MEPDDEFRAGESVDTSAREGKTRILRRAWADLVELAPDPDLIGLPGVGKRFVEG